MIKKLLLILKSLSKVWDRWRLGQIRRMKEEFESRNPGKCFYCSFHRFGRENGSAPWDSKTPPHFPCPERDLSE